MESYLNFLNVKSSLDEKYSIKEFLSHDGYPVHPKSFIPVKIRSLANEICWGLQIDMEASMGWTETEESSCLHFISFNQPCLVLLHLLELRFPDAQIQIEWASSEDGFYERKSKKSENFTDGSDDCSFCNKPHWKIEEAARYLGIKHVTLQNKIALLRKKNATVPFLVDAGGNIKNMVNRDAFLKWIDSLPPNKRGRPTKKKYS